MDFVAKNKEHLEMVGLRFGFLERMLKWTESEQDKVAAAKERGEKFALSYQTADFVRRLGDARDKIKAQQLKDFEHVLFAASKEKFIP